MSEYTQMSKGNIKTGAYTEEDDVKLVELFERFKGRPNQWKIISNELKRSHKSVRERYANHLDKTIDRRDLTNEERLKIDDLQTNPSYNGKYLKKWAVIAKELSINREQGRRTELQVKNYWNSRNRQSRRNNYEEQSNERIRKKMHINYINFVIG